MENYIPYVLCAIGIVGLALLSLRSSRGCVEHNEPVEGDNDRTAFISSIAEDISLRSESTILSPDNESIDTEDIIPPPTVEKPSPDHFSDSNEAKFSSLFGLKLKAENLSRLEVPEKKEAIKEIEHELVLEIAKNNQKKRETNATPPPINSKTRSKNLSEEWMPVFLSIMVITSALYVILMNEVYDDAQQKWAFGAVGSILGYWLKK